MAKHEVLSGIYGLDLKIEERTLRGTQLSKVTDILVDVGSTTYLTLTTANEIEGSDKVKSRWVSTVELKEWNISEVVELIVDLINFSSCEKLMIDSNGFGKGVVDALIPILKNKGKSHLLEIATEEDVKNTELFEILADIDSKMNKIKEIMSK